MAGTDRHDAWQAGDNYEHYMGRWSRQIAPLFIDWLDAPRNADWLEVGCGTGALTGTIVSRSAPKSILALDPSAGFLEAARRNVIDARVQFAVGDAQHLGDVAVSKDVTVSGLVLNFVPDRGKALAEMKRTLRPGGSIGFYVWDYPGGGIELMREFWTAAATIDAQSTDLAEDRRFPFCTPDGLSALALDAGFTRIETTALEAVSVFKDFDDYWRPFTLGAGPAPGYCMSLAPELREQLRSALFKRLSRQGDGSIHLRTRAWALKARGL